MDMTLGLKFELATPVSSLNLRLAEENKVLQVIKQCLICSKAFLGMMTLCDMFNRSQRFIGSGNGCFVTFTHPPTRNARCHGYRNGK